MINSAGLAVFFCIGEDPSWGPFFKVVGSPLIFLLSDLRSIVLLGKSYIYFRSPEWVSQRHVFLILEDPTRPPRDMFFELYDIPPFAFSLCRTRFALVRSARLDLDVWYFCSSAACRTFMRTSFETPRNEVSGTRRESWWKVTLYFFGSRTP